MLSNSHNRAEEAIQGALNLVQREERKYRWLHGGQRNEPWGSPARITWKIEKGKYFPPKLNEGYPYHMLLPSSSAWCICQGRKADT